jgi:hypothetical protein
MGCAVQWWITLFKVTLVLGKVSLRCRFLKILIQGVNFSSPLVILAYSLYKYVSESYIYTRIILNYTLLTKSTLILLN